MIRRRRLKSDGDAGAHALLVPFQRVNNEVEDSFLNGELRSLPRFPPHSSDIDDAGDESDTSNMLVIPK